VWQCVCETVCVCDSVCVYIQCEMGTAVHARLQYKHPLYIFPPVVNIVDFVHWCVWCVRRASVKHLSHAAWLWGPHPHWRPPHHHTELMAGTHHTFSYQLHSCLYHRLYHLTGIQASLNSVCLYLLSLRIICISWKYD